MKGAHHNERIMWRDKEFGRYMISECRAHIQAHMFVFSVHVQCSCSVFVFSVLGRGSRSI